MHIRTLGVNHVVDVNQIKAFNDVFSSATCPRCVGPDRVSDPALRGHRLPGDRIPMVHSEFYDWRPCSCKAVGSPEGIATRVGAGLHLPNVSVAMVIYDPPFSWGISSSVAPTDLFASITPY